MIIKFIASKTFFASLAIRVKSVVKQNSTLTNLGLVLMIVSARKFLFVTAEEGRNSSRRSDGKNSDLY